MAQDMVLVAEIGSTTTVINAFKKTNDTWIFLGQGQAPTTVEEGDVNIGLAKASQALEKVINIAVGGCRMLAASSAAGGLKMTVHGLVYDMTVKAAQEAALGAGAVLRMVTAGMLRERHLQEIEKIKPNIILLAGGVDYGEEEVILNNAKMLTGLEHKPPLIYAGNKAIKEEVEDILTEAGFEVMAADNVYPEIDSFNIEPTRRLIQKAFEKHITKGPGMAKIRDMVEGAVMPTPGAVMEAAILLQENIGDLMVLDVGGATTDVHSVTEGSPEINDILLAPEPFAKRTVEGDLGVFVNAENVIRAIGAEELNRRLGFPLADLRPSPIPQSAREEALLNILTEYVARKAVERHVGRIREIYGPTGSISMAQGKDLTRVRYIIGTGGPLTRLDEGRTILAGLRGKKGKILLPPPEAEIYIDHDYIMASLGVLSRENPEAAVQILKNTLGFC